MSKYLKLSVHEFDFDGDKVKVSLRPLKLKDALSFQSMNEDHGAVAERFVAVLPEYVESMTGLTDAAGNAVTIEEVCASVYFVQLVLDIGAALVATARLTDPQRPGAPSAG